MRALLFVALPCILAFVREEPCWSSGGRCGRPESCRTGTIRTGYCPSQPANVKCCIPRQESRCTQRRGRCKYTDQACRGRFLSNLCPTQPHDVKCCVGTSAAVPRQEVQCSSRKGRCMYTRASCGGMFVSNLCPSQPNDVKCCVPFSAVSPNPRQEAPCLSRNGLCKYTGDQCNGSFVPNLCPTQPENIKCCIGGGGSHDGGSNHEIDQVLYHTAVDTCGHSTVMYLGDLLSQPVKRIDMYGKPVNSGRSRHFGVAFTLLNGDRRFVHKVSRMPVIG